MPRKKARLDPAPAATAEPSAQSVYYLMKSEPDVFSIQDLAARGARMVGEDKLSEKTEPWTGVRNFQARNTMRAMKLGEKALFYHSNTKVPAAVGIVSITREAYPDPTQFDKKDEYYDPKSTREAPRWLCVDVKLEGIFPQPVPLTTLRSHATEELAGMQLFTHTRLSVGTVPPAAFEFITNTLAAAKQDAS
eukprot:m.139644 g.139644  ORF g.139644 m.139644 type:complete len:192 (-) comp14937_c0_seq1:78-653(-)